MASVKLAIAKLPFAAKIALEDVKPGIVPPGVDLFEAMKFTDAAKTKRWNETLESLNAMPIPNNPGRKGAATYDQALAVHQALAKNPVVENMGDYVPGGGCFAKSMIGHLEWLSAGFDKDSSLSLFQMWNNELSEEGEKPRIAFHAARAVRASDGGWWVLDPLFNPMGPVKLETWGDASTFVGEANRLLPNGQGASKFNPSQLWNWTTPNSGIIDYESPRYNGLMPAIKDHFLAKAGRRAPVASATGGVMTEADRATLAQGRGVFDTRETPPPPAIRFARLPGSTQTSTSVDEALAAMLLTPRGSVGVEAARLARRVASNEPPAVAERLLPHLMELISTSSGGRGGSVRQAAWNLRDALDDVDSRNSSGELRSLVSAALR